MPDRRDDVKTGPSSMDKTIQHIENKLYNARKLKQLLEKLDKQGDLYVENRPDSDVISVSATLDEPTEELVKLSNFDRGLQNTDNAISPEEIVYKPDTEKYNVSKKFRVRL